MATDIDSYIQIITQQQLAAQVGTGRSVVIRQERIVQINSYTTAGVPAGFVKANCNVISGQGNSTTIDLTIPVSQEKMAEFLVSYYRFALSEFPPGTQVRGADGSKGTVSDWGFINIWSGGTQFQPNNSITFREYGSEIVKIADAPV